MANVITQIEIMKYSGMDKAVFPAGTIITPSAKDWAQEQNIEIVIGDCIGESTGKIKDNIAPAEKAEDGIDHTGKDILLQQVVKSVVDNMNKTGGFLSKYELTKAVTACLKKLGCQIEN